MMVPLAGGWAQADLSPQCLTGGCTATAEAERGRLICLERCVCVAAVVCRRMVGAVARPGMRSGATMRGMPTMMARGGRNRQLLHVLDGDR